MTDEIKKMTAPAHQALEGLLIPIIKNTYTVAGYGKLLCMFYGYYKPLEDALDGFSMQDVLPDYTQRRKARLITDDLKALGHPVHDLPLCPVVPAPGSREEAFGALYVLEGSTLGGLIIKKILQRNLQQQGEGGFAFFTGYGERTHAWWQSFKAALDQYCTDNAQTGRLAAAANQTFQYLKSWTEHCYHYEPAKEKL